MITVSSKFAVHVSLAMSVAIFTAICDAQAPAALSTAFSLEQQAVRAYGKKHYGQSAHLFEAAFAAGLSRSDDAYNAACSYALARDASRALAYLDRAVNLGFRDPEQMKNDSGLTSLRGDRKFPLLVDHATANKRAYDAAHRDTDLAAIVTSDVDLFCCAYQRIKNASSLYGQGRFDGD